MKTMICLILDRSGSMSGLESDVIGGINTFIEDQKKLPEPASIAFVRFDSMEIERFRAMKPLEQCEPLTAGEYQPRGGTPLLDAVGRTIAQLGEDWKTEKPERAIIVIVTDGCENASREYTKAKIQEMIKARQDSGKWAFIYLGANVDAFSEAGSIGISMANSAGYVNSHAGVRAMYVTASNAVGMMRATGHTFAHNLGGNIGEDGSINTKAAQAAPTQPRQSPSASGASNSTTWTPPA